MTAPPTETISRRTIVFVLRGVFVGVIVAGGFWIYWSLPPNETDDAGERSRATTNLHITMRVPEGDHTSLAGVPVQLYAVDVAAVQGEYLSERRAGMRFEDFMQRRMAGRAPLTARLDEHGQARIQVSPGRWWIHATEIENQNARAEELMWRLPVNVRGQTQEVELTPDNVYMRTRDF